MRRGEPGDYGVKVTPAGDVEIRLGPLAPFEVPPDVAIKLALLLLSHAGCDVHIGDYSAVVHYPGAHPKN